MARSRSKEPSAATPASGSGSAAPAPDAQERRFIGGYPEATADPRGITSLNWSFDGRWTDSPDDHAYPVTIIVDDVRLMPKDVPLQPSMTCEDLSTCEPHECTTAPIAPTDPLITDWSDLSEDGMFIDSDHYSEEIGSLQWLTGFFGRPYAYPVELLCPGEPWNPEYLLSHSVDGGTWRIEGEVGNWSGFGLYFGGCAGVDFSEYRGIEFSIGGDVGPTGALRFYLVVPANSPKNAGGCEEPFAECDAATTPCIQPSVMVPVTAAPSTLTFLWDDFGGGSPAYGLDPVQITGLRFEFEWSSLCSYRPAGCAYPVDVAVDDIRLVE